MADYKKMYLTALDAMERAMELLAEAERACEEIYIQTDTAESGVQLLPFPEDKREKKRKKNRVPGRRPGTL